MKIELISRENINQEKWSILIKESNVPFFMSMYYLDVVWKNWSAVVVEDYESCFPVRIRSVFGKKISVHPLFVTKLEVLGNQSHLDNIVQFLIDNLSLVHLFVDEQFKPFVKNYKTRIYQVLELNKNYDELKKSFSQNAKRLISKFDKSDGIIHCDDNIEQLKLLLDFFKVQKGSVYKNITSKSIQMLELLIQKAKDKADIQIIRAISNGEICAFGVFLIESKKALYLNGTVNDIGKKNGAMFKVFETFLMNNSMSIDWLDFGGSNDKGISDFNRKFGSVNMKYINFTVNKMSFPFLKIFNNRYRI